MRRSRLALALLVPLLLVACGEPTLKSDDFDGSAKKLRESVSQEERPALGAAIALVRQASAGEVAGTEPFSVDGMTAADVLSEARRIELRQEKAWIEEEIAARRELFSEAERLAGLGSGPLEVAPNGVLTMRVRNNLDEPLTTGWVRTSVELPDGRVFSSEDYVGFGRALQPGEERDIKVEVTGDAHDLLPAPPEFEVTAVFTMVEHAGTLVAKEPNDDEIARAKVAIEKAEKELADVERRLQEVG